MCTAVSTKVVPQKRTRQCRLVLWVERVYRWLIKVHGFYQQEKRRHKYICLLFRFMSLKHLKPESRTMNPHYPKHLLALSSTVLLDNLSQNSCMNKNSNNIAILLSHFTYFTYAFYLMEGDGYETQQISLLYVFVLFFGLDRAQHTIVVLLRTEDVTNRNVLVT